MTSAAGVVLAYLATANAIVGVFNLLPAFPMDGGRILQAIVWAISRDRTRATRIAGRVGIIVAWMMIGYGVFDVLLQGFGAGLWFTLIGWFLLLSAQGEERQARLQVALRGHSAGATAAQRPAPDATPPMNAPSPGCSSTSCATTMRGSGTERM